MKKNTKTQAQLLSEKKKSGVKMSRIHYRRKTKWECSLEELRKELGLTIQDVAVAIAVSPQTIKAIQLGFDLSLSLADKVAKFFGLEVHQMWKEIKPNPPNNETKETAPTSDTGEVK